MKLTLEPTEQIVRIPGEREARVWIGHDEQGVPVQAIIAMVAVESDLPPEVHERFAARLIESPQPSPERRAFDLRFFVG